MDYYPLSIITDHVALYATCIATVHNEHPIELMIRWSRR